jgi:hypothetical protein
MVRFSSADQQFRWREARGDNLAGTIQDKISGRTRLARLRRSPVSVRLLTKADRDDVHSCHLVYRHALRTTASRAQFFSNTASL